MGYRSPIRSSRGDRGYQKAQHRKSEKQKHQAGSRRMIEEESQLTTKEIVEKTLGSLHGLGEQRFAVSPFSEYFNNWLLSLRNVLLVFESTIGSRVDEEFVRKQVQILAGIESDLAQVRLQEKTSEEMRKTLSEKRHALAEIDSEYASATKEKEDRRNVEIQNLTRTVRHLEAELDQIGKTKTTFFGTFSRKAKAQKEAEAKRKIDAAKRELEMATRNFALEEEKNRQQYENRKQVVVAQVQKLEEDIGLQEIDASLERRRVACEAFAGAINSLIKRDPTFHNSPT